MKKYSVMMIDDDTFTNELARMVIKWSSYSSYFRVTESAYEAIKELQELYDIQSKKFPDYILLDLKMPEIHGFDFIRKFESRFPERKNKTHFIITTSSLLKKDKQEAFNFDSVIDYIVKPVPGNYLESLIINGYSRTQKVSTT